MEHFRLNLRNHSVGDHIKCSPNCCLKLTLAFVTVVPVAIVLALLNISPSVNDVLVVIIVVDSILMIISAVCWVILLRRKKKLRDLAALIQQEGFGTKLEHCCTIGSPGSNMDAHRTSVGNELLSCTSTQPANSNDLPPRLSPLNIGSSRENDHQSPSPDVPTSSSVLSTPDEAAKVFTFYYDENEGTWKFKNASSSTDPSKSESVRHGSPPSSASLANSCDLAQRQLPTNAGLLKESDCEEPSPDIKTSDSIPSTPNEVKPYTLYYDEDLKIFTFKNSSPTIADPESKCCVPKCWPRPMKPTNVDRLTLSEKDASFEFPSVGRNDHQQHLKEIDKGYLASVESSYSSLEHSQFNLSLSQANPKQVHFAQEVEHLTSGEDNASNRERNQQNPSSFPTQSIEYSQGLPIAQDRHVTFQEHSIPNFPRNKKGRFTSSDGTSSSCDFGEYNPFSYPINPSQDLPITEGRHLSSLENSQQGFPGNKSEHLPSSDTTSSLDFGPNRGRQRQRSLSHPSQKKTPDISERPSFATHGTMHSENFPSSTNQIQSSSTPRNTSILPANSNTKRSRILHQLLSAVLRKDAEVLPEVNSPHDSEEPMSTEARRLDIPNVKFNRLPTNDFLVNITMTLTPSEFHYFMEKRKNSGTYAVYL